MTPNNEAHDSASASAFNAAYVLPSHSAEIKRLIGQHAYLINAFDERLWNAPLELKHLQGARILDAGTGSGVWLFDLSNRLREAGITPTQLLGIDMSADSFANTPLKDDQVEFKACNVTSMPLDWSNSFGLIHQRLLIGGLQNWETALKEMFRVLKPGGHIQLCETSKLDDLAGWRVDPGSAVGQLKTAMLKLFKARGLDYNISFKLPKMLCECGFKEVKLEQRYSSLNEAKGEVAVKANELFVESIGYFGKHLIEQGSYADQAEIEQLQHRVRKQFNDEDIEDIFEYITARKPT